MSSVSKPRQIITVLLWIELGNLSDHEASGPIPSLSGHFIILRGCGNLINVRQGENTNNYDSVRTLSLIVNGEKESRTFRNPVDLSLFIFLGHVKDLMRPLYPLTRRGAALCRTIPYASLEGEMSNLTKLKTVRSVRDLNPGLLNVRLIHCATSLVSIY